MATKLLCDGAVSVDPNVMSGAPVFAGTRVPIKNLFDYLSAGKSKSEFLAAFDWVNPEEVDKVLMSAYRSVFEPVKAA